MVAGVDRVELVPFVGREATQDRAGVQCVGGDETLDLLGQSGDGGGFVLVARRLQWRRGRQARPDAARLPVAGRTTAA